MAERVFMTGASGFVGGAVARDLLARGDAVAGLARSDEAAGVLTERGLAVVRGSVLDGDALASGMAGCDLVFHVAAENTHCPADPDGLLRVNVGGTEAVVRAAAAAGVRRVVLTSSSASVGEAHGTVATEDSPHRGSYLSVYDRSKHESERRAFALGAELGVDVVAVNPSSVQGPGRTAGNGKIILAYLNGKLPVFVDTFVSICDIDDCARAHLLAADRGAPGARYILNSATITSDEALTLVRGLSGIDDAPRIVPHWVARAAGGAAELVAKAHGKTPSLCRARVATILHGHRYDGSLATRELGLAYTEPRETFHRTIAWAVAEGLVTRPLPAFGAGS